MKKAILTLLLALALNACNDQESKSISTSINEDKVQKPINCSFEIVATPAKFKTIPGTNKEFINTTAFKTPSCKIVAIGVYYIGSVFLARFDEKGEPDTTYAENGIVRQKILSGFGVFSLNLFSYENRIILSGFAWNNRNWEGGPFISLLDAEGVFDQTVYNNGIGYAEIIKGPSFEQFSIDSIAVDSGKAEIKGRIFSQNDKKFLEFTKYFNLTKPTLSVAKHSFPEKCTDYKFFGNMNMRTLEITPKKCEILSVFDSAFYSNKSFDIIPDGRCAEYGSFGYRCFYYEDGFLASEYVSEYWELRKTYFKIIRSGTLGESYYKPSDPRFNESYLEWP